MTNGSKERKPLAGIIPALITPCTDSGTVDFGLLERQAAYLSNGNVDGIFIGGTTAEGPYLSIREKGDIFRAVREASGGKQYLCAVLLAPSTRQVLQELEAIAPLEPDYISAVPPFYFPPTRAAIVEHYRTLAEASPVPVILYNIPQNTHSPMDLETVLELAAMDNIAGIKDSSGNFIQFSRGLLAGTPPEFAWIQGDDLLDGASMLYGAEAIVTGLGNVWIEPYVSLYRNARSGDRNGVLAEQAKINRLAEIIFRTGWKVIPAIKSACALQGRSTGRMLVPAMSLNREETETVRTVLEELGLV